jgi:hypothetical protein
MSMIKVILTFSVLMGLCGLAAAQDFQYGNVTQEEIDMKSYPKDPSAHAVVLQEFGKARIDVANDDEIKLIYDYHVKIKIFDSKGFDEATAEIKLRNNSDNTEADQLEKIEGVTYYLNDNGALDKTEFDHSKVFTTRDYKYQQTAKFTMPGLRDGCIIEYKYTLVSPIGLCLDHFRPWEFQSDIPKISSVYEAIIPGHFTYNAVLKGYLKLSRTKSDVIRNGFTTHGAASDCSDMTYGMNDIPAFKEEDFMTSSKNYISAITFDIVQFTNPYTGATVKETKEWKDIDYSLKTDPDFGGQLKKKDFFKEKLAPVIAGKNDDLEKAKAIYAYLQHWYKWNDYIGYGTDEGIKKAYETHSGSIGDINISLIDALNSAGINTEAVLLSTRDNGAVNEVYPAVNSFNYVIAKATIGDKNYFLDATDPLLSFGMLPLRCLNGKGRAYALDKPSYWIDLDLPQRQKSTRSLDLTLQEDGKLKGTMVTYSFGYDAYLKRLAIKKFNNTDEYVEKLGEASPKLKIIKSEILNLDSLDNPVIEKYEIEFNAFNKLDNRIAFNPFLWDRVEENPFKLDERSYPVDWGMPSDDRLILTVHLPAQYAVETPPQTVAVAMPDNGGKFLTDYQPDNDAFTFSHVIEFNKGIYSPDEYPYLKEFYNKIIQSEKAEIVFKKK